MAKMKTASELLKKYNNDTNASDALTQPVEEPQVSAEELMRRNYASGISAIEQNRNDANQAAAITLERLKKYLPDQLKQNGLGGSGLSETTLAGAYNNYANQVGLNERAYQNAKDALEQNYLTKQLEQRESQNNEIKTAASALIENGKGASAQNLLDKYKTNIGDASYDAASALAKYYEPKEESGGFSDGSTEQTKEERIRNEAMEAAGIEPDQEVDIDKLMKSVYDTTKTKSIFEMVDDGGNNYFGGIDNNGKIKFRGTDREFTLKEYYNALVKAGVEKEEAKNYIKMIQYQLGITKK